MKYYSNFLPYTFLAVMLVGLYYLLENRLTKPWMRWAWWFGSLIVILAAGWQVGVEHPWADFGNGYYFAGRKILRAPSQIYSGENCNGYVNFPLLAYIFSPFGFMPKAEAGRIFFLINLVSLMPLAYWLIKFGNLKGWKRWTLLAFLLFSGPLDYSIWLGNSTSLIMLGIIAALWLFRRGNEWGAGILLAITGLIKIPIILPSGYYFIRRRWKVVLGGMLVVGSVVILSLALIPFSLNRIWVNKCILSFVGRPVAAYNNQPVTAVLARELIADSKIDSWIPIASTPLFDMASKAAMALLYMPLLIVLLYAWKSARAPSGYLLEFFIALACSLLTSPISWTHYFMFLLIPTAFYLGGDLFSPQRKGLNLLLGMSLILLTLPVELTLEWFRTSGERIFLSLHFMGGLVFYLFLFVLWLVNKNKLIKVQ